MINWMYHIKRLHIIEGIVVLLILWGCGRKGPPVPPHKFVPPSVKGLEYSIDEDLLILTWTIPEIREEDRKKLTGCTVFRSKKSLAESPCVDCPPDFKQILDIPMKLDAGEDMEQREITYQETLEQGYHYVYRVIFYSNKGISSKESRFVDFEY